MWKLTWLRAPVLAVATLGPAAPAARAADCSATSIGVAPIDDLGTGTYLGFEGGLYPGGSNTPPAAHATEGRARANGLQPLDAAGEPSPDGAIVLLSIGPSNATQEFCSASGAEPCLPGTFMGMALGHPDVDDTHLVIANGALAGQANPSWDSPTDPIYDYLRDVVLAGKGLTEAQVRAVWLKNVNPLQRVPLPDPGADAFALVGGLADVVRAAKIRYPNLAFVFLSSRIYAGYATIPLYPEPYAYESGFSVKWLIEAQTKQMDGAGIDPIAGDLDYAGVAPFLAWGPYLWADGTTPRSDGLVWNCDDFEADGFHPSVEGEHKVGAALLDFMLTSEFAAPWFAVPEPSRWLLQLAALLVLAALAMRRRRAL